MVWPHQGVLVKQGAGYNITWQTEHTVTSKVCDGSLCGVGSSTRGTLTCVSSAHVASSVLHMASLPLEANVQFMTVMATKMPYIGRG